MNILCHARGGDGKGNAVSVAEAADGEEDCDDQVTDAGWPGGGQVMCSVFAMVVIDFRNPSMRLAAECKARGAGL